MPVWAVPTAIARASTPVLSTKSFCHPRICIEISRIDMGASLCRIRVVTYMSEFALDGCSIRMRDVCHFF